MYMEGGLRCVPCLSLCRGSFKESLVETLDVLSDPEMVSALRESLEDRKRERLYSHAEAKRRLGV